MYKGSSLMMVRALGSVVGLTLFACSGTHQDQVTPIDADVAALKKSVLTRYVATVHDNYEEAIARAEALQAAVNAFVADPTQMGFDAAKSAWLNARPSYGQTEAFRFYAGPIDGVDGPEGRINGWPLDENYIDYVVSDANAGIINSDDSAFATISAELIADNNEKGGEKNLSAGYHAIEFLLWGQDLNDAGHENEPGRRPFTDYVDGGTAGHQSRRRTYLQETVKLLIEDLEDVEHQWETGEAEPTYAMMFLEADADASLAKMITGVGNLLSGELAEDRMNNAYVLKEQEEEHSCFSDNTKVDLLNNLLGAENVYLGRYGDDDGDGLDALVMRVDAPLDAQVKAQFAAAKEAIASIEGPFDQAIVGADDAPGRKAVKRTIDAVRALGKSFADVAAALGLSIAPNK